MQDRTTSIELFIAAPAETVYAALTDPVQVRQWMVPDNMSMDIHEFDATVGGRLRISLTYKDQNAAGKTSAHTDTYHGHFVELVPGERIVQALEFESTDSLMQGAMQAEYQFIGVPGGTGLTAIHSNLPPGLSPEVNELGWRLSLGKLKDLVEQDQTSD